MSSLDDSPTTVDVAYTSRLRRSLDDPLSRLKQLPYRLHVKQLSLGSVLDLGCGVGRNLEHHGAFGVGIDHNETSVAVARERGSIAFTPEAFRQSPYAQRAYDSILCAHVAEHVEEEAFLTFLRAYIPLLAPSGRVVLITPQKRGYDSDPTHVRFVDFDGQRRILEALDLDVETQYSFPFPAFAGNAFTYNEFVSRARKR